MPSLAWRNDADGFAFINSWTLDATERAALTGLAQPLVAAAVGTIAAIIPDPIFLTAVTVAANGYLSFGSHPSYGLCGGMAYYALDYWNARVPIPRGAHGGDQPPRNAPAPTALRDLIWKRLLDSLGPGGVLQRTLEWSLILNQVPKEVGGGATGLKNRTLLEWDRIRGHIDAGRPWPIGLVYANTDVWYQHQILVYGYENTGANQGTLFVYDNNSPSQFGAQGHSEVTLDFRGQTLVATSAFNSDINRLAGFFCSGYFPGPPLAMSKSYGEFLTWTGDARTWMATDGARMPIANSTELSALGGSAQSVRPTGSPFAPSTVRPRDGAKFRERSSTAVFLYAGGAPFLLPDTLWLDRFGGAGQVRVVPDNTIAAFSGLPIEGTLLREWSDPRVWRIMSGLRRWVRTPEELGKWGGFPSVRVVPDGALAAIPVGQPLPIEPVLRWNWSNMGKPAGANIHSLMGAVSAMDTPTSPQRPHLFVAGNDGNLWCLWSSGSAWNWLNMGRPPGVGSVGQMGAAVSVMDTPASPQRPHLFLVGNDANLWCRLWSGSAWDWRNMGKPPGANIHSLMGAVSAMDTPTSSQRPHLFVAGNDGNLWCLWSSGSAWNWLNMGRPPGVGSVGLMGAAVSVKDTPASPQRPHLFLVGSDANLWCRWSSGSAWDWGNLGKPAGANIHSLMGAVSVMDTPTAPQRPHLFAVGNDGNLWIAWWG